MPSSPLSQLCLRREQICNQIAAIKTMRRGSFNQWNYRTTLKDGTVKEHGPFFKITRKDKNNKSVATTVPKAELDYYKQEAANYKMFRELSDEYAEVCEQISILSHADEDAKKN